MERKKIFLDTDIGTDIDDALALVFAAKNPAAKIMGVTTVTGNTIARAKIAAYLLGLCGLGDVPVAAGTGSATATPPCQFFDCMETTIPLPDAPTLLLETVAQNPGMTIVTLGPLSNIARCIQLAPKTMEKASLVIMGGMVSKPFAEGNIHADPEAAKTVFSFPMAKTMVGLDVTTRCEMADRDIQKVLNIPAEPNATLYKMFKSWKKEVLAPILKSWGQNVTGEDFPASAGMHDPMAVAYALRPDLFSTKKTCVVVETEGIHGRGLTLEQVNPFRGNKPLCEETEVAVGVNENDFMDYFLGILKQ